MLVVAASISVTMHGYEYRPHENLDAARTHSDTGDGVGSEPSASGGGYCMHSHSRKAIDESASDREGELRFRVSGHRIQ